MDEDDLFEIAADFGPNRGNKCPGQPAAPSTPNRPPFRPSAVNTPLTATPGKRSVPSPCLTPHVPIVSAERFVTLPMEPALRERLMPHQQEGVEWLFGQHKVASGCLLADEMGLGKTVQVAAFLGVLFRQGVARTALIVVPSSLLDGWLTAMKDWGHCLPHQIDIVHNDKKPARDARWLRLAQQQHSYNNGSVVVITTYGLMKRDIASIRKVKLDYIVLDEAHLIKDPTTETSKAALDLRAHHKIALTGTPLMNHFQDLWSLFEFLDPALLGSDVVTFGSMSDAILRSNEKDSVHNERVYGQQQLALLQAKITPRVLRREKAALRGDGPSSAPLLSCQKHDVVVWVTLSETQRLQYLEFLQSDVVQIALRQLRVKQPLVLLNALRNIVNHPWLNFSDNNFREAMATPLHVPTELPEFGDITSSAKLMAGVELVHAQVQQLGQERPPWDARGLPRTDGGAQPARTKMLVFSRSKRLLDIFGFLLQHRGITHMRLDGDVAAAQRGKLVRQFATSDTCMVCLLTTQVGGVGLTFNCASRVLLLDPSWNPAVDAQAVDRVHRIGQLESHVIVFRLIAAGTVDEKIYRNQIYKTTAALQLHQKARGTSSSTQHNEDNSNDDGRNEPQQRYGELQRYFTRQQLRCMFELGDCTKSETAEQLHLVRTDGREDVQEDTPTRGDDEEQHDEASGMFRSIRQSVLRSVANVCAVTNHGGIFDAQTRPVEVAPSADRNIDGQRTAAQARGGRKKRLHTRNAPPTASLSELAEQLDDFDRCAFDCGGAPRGEDDVPRVAFAESGRCSILRQDASLEEIMRTELSRTHMFFHGVPIRRLNLDEVFAEGRPSAQLDAAEFRSASEEESEDESHHCEPLDWAAFEENSPRRPSVAVRAQAARSALLRWQTDAGGE